MSMEISLDEKVAFLSAPSAYRPIAAQDSTQAGVADVERIETHMAYVFLAGPSAYKMKKPVKFDFLDFSTLDRRREDCRREVEVNRALAGGVYHGTVPLVAGGTGELNLGGEGKVVEWLVHMRRLPHERMLDVRIEKGVVTNAEVRRVVAELCRFYRSQPPHPVPPESYRQRIVDGINGNERDLTSARYGLSRATIEEILGVQRRFTADAADLLEQRARDGRIVDGHGDLRPEHIRLVSPPVIFDRIEFNDRFRILDAADELSYVRMECDLLGAARVGRVASDAYRDRMDDDPPSPLLHFYRSHRACVRAVLAVKHLDDEGADVNKWTYRTNSYLDLAKSYLPGMEA